MTIQNRALIVEFTGTPNAGKTTLIRHLKDSLSRKGIIVETIKEDAEIVPKQIPKKTWDRNVWITFSQLRSLAYAKYSNANIVLLDRGYYDALFWADFLKFQNICSSEESESLKRILMEANYNLGLRSDYLILIDVSTEESIRRHGGTGIYTKNDFIDAYKKTMNDFFAKFPTQKIFKIDTTNMSVSEALYILVRKIEEIYNS